MNKFALLGSTASGKTSLALTLANKLNGVILSLDSLSIYKEIDIASAKPSKLQRDKILHFGIDVINPNDEFNVTLFFKLFKEAKRYAQTNNKTLIIVGGTSFYLKSMLTGLSKKPPVSLEVKEKILTYLSDLNSTYELVKKVDFNYAKNISKNDIYRIEKWLEIYLTTLQTPSEYLKKNQTKPILENISIFELLVPKDTLNKNITLRTESMLKDGLIDEVFYLEKKYTREKKALNAIGLKEVLDYFDGEYNLHELKDKIITNTARLAKRQRTFNKTQFKDFDIFQGDTQFIENECLSRFT